MPWLGIAYGAQRNALVKRGKATAVFHRQREQIRVSDLIRSKDAAWVKNIPIGDRDVVRPKLMVGPFSLFGKTGYGL